MASTLTRIRGLGAGTGQSGARETLWQLLRRDGAVLVSLDHASIDDFNRCTELLATNFRVHHSPERTWVGPAGTTQTVSRGMAPIDLHSELAYLPNKPELLFFFCVRAARAAGETVICDGAAIFSTLPPAIRHELAGASLLWHTPAPPLHAGGTERAVQRAEQWFQCPCVERGWIGGRVAFANYLLLREADGPTVTTADGTPVPEQWLVAARAAARRHSVSIRWRPGDLLVLDNTRWLHARRASLDADRRLLVRMGDVNRALNRATARSGQSRQLTLR